MSLAGASFRITMLRGLGEDIMGTHVNDTIARLARLVVHALLLGAFIGVQVALFVHL